ncbi:MAG TPA: DNA primase [Acidobacteriota bacterium]|nr:DNA primase [Acidobacteriota bacterium]HNT17363.1 DNA primase [Acidobacteriota bacterium]
MTKISTVDELKSYIAPITVYEDYLKLSAKGRRRLALCPFHKEKTPSFSVDTDSGLFYCFGCHKGGDVIKFIEEIERCSFEEAISILARKAGVELERSGRYNETGGEDGKKREKLLNLLSFAAGYYRECLAGSPEGSPVKRYIREREIPENAVNELQLGYAPERSSLISGIIRAGFTKEEAVEAGVLKESKRGEYFEYFRDRLMFPIIDVGGRVVGFGGRTIGKDEPKYLNTPETAVFRKRDLLYGLNFSRDSIRQEDRGVLVEGYMDFLSLYARGVRCVAASLGTALTPSQAALMKRYSHTVVLLYDTDEAGQAAMERALPILLGQGLKVKIALMEGAKDPDECVKSIGAERFRELLDRSEPFFRHILGRFRARDLGSVEEKLKFLDYAAPHLSSIPDPIEREAFINEFSERTGLKKSLVVEKIDKKGPAPKPSEQPAEEEISLSVSEHVLVKAALSGNNDFMKKLLEIPPKLLDSMASGRLLRKKLEGTYITDEKELKLEAFVKNSCHEVQSVDDIDGAVYSLEKELLEKNRREVTLRLRESREKGDRELEEIYTRELLAIVNEAKNIQNTRFGSLKGD